MKILILFFALGIFAVHAEPITVLDVGPQLRVYYNENFEWLGSVTRNENMTTYDFDMDYFIDDDGEVLFIKGEDE